MKSLIQSTTTPVILKTRELCQAILDQPAYRKLREEIDAFLQNPEMVESYQHLCDLQDRLHARQHEGQALTDEELADYENAENVFLKNPAAQAFINAQQSLHKIESTVTAYVRKTLELNRVPEDEDFSGGGCGPGCGCGH